MSLTAQEEAWRVLSESVFAEMASWRKEHPTATFAEIEEELDARLSGVRALMLQDLAQESQKRDWREQAKAERPRCPQCGRPLQARGKQERRLLTQGGRQVKLERQYGSWEDVWQRLFSPWMKN